MSFLFSPLSLPGLVWFQPVRHRDQRGQFSETYRAAAYQEAGLPAALGLQDNLVSSRAGVIRGLHFQKEHPQGKLIYVPQGEIFDVAVDLRPDSSTWGRFWAGRISRENGGQLYVPPGFAHGYQALKNDTLVIYKCSAYYDPADEGGLAYDDPVLNVPWPRPSASLSAKDQAWPTLARIHKEMR